MYSDTDKINMYKTILDALTYKPSIQSIAKTAYECFHLPILIVDISFKLLAIESGGKHLPEPGWNTIMKNGEAPIDDIVNCYLKDGYFDKVSKSSEAIHLDWGITKPFPQTCGPIRVNGNVEGFVSVLFMDMELLPMAKDLNDLLSLAVSIIMQSEPYITKHTVNPIREILAREIFTEYSTPDVKKFEQFISLQPKYLILILDNIYQNSGRLQYVRNLLCRQYSNMLFTSINKKLYIFFTGLISEESVNQIYRNIEQLAEQYSFVCGISYLFSELGTRHQYFIQAEKALEIGKLTCPESFVFHYKDLFPEIIMSFPAQELDPVNYILPEIKRLIDFDHKNNTEYFATLQSYLQNLNNVSKTTEDLHIHRNTLMYRLEKIMDFINVDINDPKEAIRLLISLQVMKMGKKLKF